LQLKQDKMASELKILHEKENPLFSRKEVQIIINSDKTPSKEDSLKLLSDNFSVSPECIAIKTIKGKFGRDEFTITSNLYKSEDAKNRVEPRLKKKKEAAK